MKRRLGRKKRNWLEEKDDKEELEEKRRKN